MYLLCLSHPSVFGLTEGLVLPMGAGWKGREVEVWRVRGLIDGYLIHVFLILFYFVDYYLIGCDFRMWVFPVLG